MSAYVIDQFNRASFGTVTDSAGASLGSIPWTVQAGSWTIISSTLAATSVSTAASIVTCDPALADVDISLTLNTWAVVGIVFRYQYSSNYWYLHNTGTTLQLVKFSGGVPVSTTNATGSNVNGDIIRVLAFGSTIICYRSTGAATSFQVSDSAFSTATKHGLYSNSNTTGRLDNFSINTLSFSFTLAETVGITDVLSRSTVKTRSFFETVGITDSVATRSKLTLAETVGISDTLGIGVTLHNNFQEVVGVTDTLTVSGALVQMDSWRPIPKPDNSIVLLCRTPVGEHDSPTGLTHLTLWTVFPDGSEEHPAVLSPADNGWDSYSHPEWAPSGDEIIVAAETSTEYRLVTIDATGFGS
jgi:hypothetical protein